MIDAYTIGITLALDDNVSAGIAAIREQLLAVDRMIAQTTASLGELQALGRRVGSVGAAPLVPERPPATKQIRETTPEQPSQDTRPITAKQEMGSAASSATLQPRAPASPAAPQMPPAPPADAALVLAQPQKPEPQASPLVPIAPIRTPAEPDKKQSQVLAPPLADFAPPAPTNDRAMMPAPTIIVQQPSRETREADLSSASVLPAPSSPIAASPRPLAPARRDSDVTPRAAAAAAAQQPADTVTAAPSVTRPTSFAPSTLPAPMREQDAEPPSGARERSVALDNRPAERVRAEEQSETPPAQISGEITLDGARLGRWVADMLAEIASRPPGGTTGFDPRITPNWPGLMGG